MDHTYNIIPNQYTENINNIIALYNITLILHITKINTIIVNKSIMIRIVKLTDYYITIIIITSAYQLFYIQNYYTIYQKMIIISIYTLLLN